MSKVEVNEIDKQSGSTLTIGGSGTTVQLGTGATQSGFGRSGSVNWQTGSIKTSTFTAVSGEGYFINQSSAITVNLPAGSPGAIVAFSDYARNFETYNFTVTPNGSEKIGGFAASAKLNVDGQAATFVYVDSTKGWINVQNAEDTEVAATFITATGGTETNSPCGNFKIHTFTGPGTFCVSAVGTPGGSTTVDWLVVGGGGGGGVGRANTYAAGGGGAGGMRFNFPNTVNAGTPVAAQGYPITVGAGGARGSEDGAGNNGSDSIAALACGPYVSAGGGKGASGPGNAAAGAGGSGGGAGYSSQSGAAGNTPPVTPPQGNNGGEAPGIPGPANPGINAGGGGGGHGGVGANSTGPQCGGGGGVGTPLTIADSPALPGGRIYAGGGSGAQAPTPASTGAPGGGGVGRGTTEKNGTANTGGGGGSGWPCGGGDGGSGVVIIRYKFQ